MGKKIGAVIAGILVAFTTVAVVEMLGHTIYPVPEGLDIYDEEVATAYIETLPIGALLFVILAWVLGAVSGSFAAGKIAGPPTKLYTEIVTGVVVLASVMNIIAIPHPTWFTIVALGLLVLSMKVSEMILAE